MFLKQGKVSAVISDWEIVMEKRKEFGNRPDSFRETKLY